MDVLHMFKIAEQCRKRYFFHLTTTLLFIFFAVKVPKYIPEQCSILSFNILLHISVANDNMISIKVFISLWSVKKNARHTESVVPYDFFSPLFCLSLEKLIGVALPSPNADSADSSVTQRPSQVLLLRCAHSANFVLSSVYAEMMGSVCRWDVGGHWLTSVSVVGIALAIQAFPKPVSHAAVHTAQLPSVWLHMLLEDYIWFTACI